MSASLVTLTEREYLDGVAKQYIYDNGYGASVIRHQNSYGSKQGKWELAVTEGKDNELCYTTHITSDVLGYLTEVEVDDILKQIAEL